MNRPLHDRRWWLQAVAGSLLTPHLAPGSAANELLDPSPMSKLNVAVVGVANHAATNLAAMRGQRVQAICDVDGEYLERAHQQFPAATVERDWRQMLEQPDLDAVVISIPDHGHAACALQAITLGLHVYCEKPLAHQVLETRQLAGKAAASGLVTQFGNQHQSSPGYQRAIQWLRAELLGEVRLVTCWTNRPIWPQGISRPRGRARIPRTLEWDLWLGPAPERRYHPIYHPLNWRGWWDFGCGALGDMGPHLLDPVFAGLQLSSPSLIEAESDPPNDWTFPASSHVRWLFLRPQSNRPGLEVHWYDGQRKPSLTAADGTPLRLPASGVLVEGQRGKMFIPALGGQPRLLGPVARDAETPRPEPLPSHQQQWLAACQQGTATRSPFSYGATLTETCLLGNIAIRSGRSIAWDAKNGQITNHADLNQLLSRQPRQGWSS